MYHKCKHMYYITYLGQQILNKANICKYGECQTYDAMTHPTYNKHVENTQCNSANFVH